MEQNEKIKAHITGVKEECFQFQYVPHKNKSGFLRHVPSRLRNKWFIIINFYFAPP